MSVTVNGVTTAPVIRDMVKGAIMHRFYTDRSIREYCKEQGYTDPSVSDTGGVFATLVDHSDFPTMSGELQIGWVG